MLLALASVQLFFIGGMVCVCVGGSPAILGAVFYSFGDF